MEPGNFTNLSWDQGQDGRDHNSSVANPHGETEPAAPMRRSSSTSMQAGRDADDLDLAGVGTATLECTVTQPMKENDGTKDAYVSYLVTTHVWCLQALDELSLIEADHLSLFCKANHHCPQALHRLRIPLQDSK
jgi:hypothetical protein